MDRVRIAAPPHAGGRGRDARLRAAVRRRSRAVGPDRAAARPRLRALSRTSTTAIPATRCASSRRAATRPSWCARSPRTPTSWASRARPPMEKALYAVDELSGFVLACAYVRPEGLVGMTPKSVKKKLKQPSFAAAVSRDDLRDGRRGAGRRLRRAPRHRDRGAGRSGSDELMPGRGRHLSRDGRVRGDQHRRAGGRRDRAGAARAVAARARPGLLGLELELRALRPLAREPARHRQPGRHRRRGGDARGRPRPEGGDDHARGRRRRRLSQPHPARGRSTAR